ncbi:glutamate receptor ionotropic, NMDA 1-like [Xenia sp. Carnegie-2017]|uniref:glutamate receptor ionotropic, NMDA 1-like n=1 Tax=Xenia sp. Carnegie-2017 TaxID=2897299 RepID=UPI001F0336DE|nr:glutamate receptor ionotropic, NMDA 1-like [Xenia sp. Carnegie-2017]
MNFSNTSIQFEALTISMNKKPIQASLDVCDNILNKNVHAVFVINDANFTNGPAMAVSYTCGFFQIPVIGIGIRNSVFSNKTVQPTFIRTVSPYYDQVNVWIKILKHFGWKKVLTISTGKYESKRALFHFVDAISDSIIKIEKSVELLQEKTNVTKELEELSNTLSRVILIFVDLQDAKIIYNELSQLLPNKKGYVWLVMENAVMDENKNIIAPQGSLSVQLTQESDLIAHLYDSVDMVTQTITSWVSYNNETDKKFLTNGCHSLTPWSTGKTLYQKLLNTSIPNGRTGVVKFDENGERANSKYRITNVQKSGLEEIGNHHEGKLNIFRPIVWPGDTTDIPKGIQSSKHMRVVTIKQHPFVYVHENPTGKCSDLNTDVSTYVECPGKQNGVDKEHAIIEDVYCCSGFCIDLLQLLADNINFTYEVHLSKDGKFGSYNEKPGHKDKKWNGMVEEILEDQADMIVASLTINNERAKVIDFTKPFKYEGKTILVKKNEKSSSLGSFLRPFRIELWLLVLLSVHVVAVFLYLLDRFSPFGRFQMAKCDREDTPLNLTSAMWFAWGVLLNSGIGEGTPRSLSARVLGMAWAGFAMIIVASYTANLAAFLVLDRPMSVVSGIDDPQLRNPTSHFKYGTVANSSVESYFRRQEELSTMAKFMDSYNVDSVDDGVQAVRDGELKAFIWDSPVLYYETTKDCSLTTAGELFGRSAYGVGLPKNSPWTNEVSLAILNFHESGKMEDLETLWIETGACAENTNVSTTLGLGHMMGVFFMMLAGIGAVFIIIVFELLYYKHQFWRAELRNRETKTTADRKNDMRRKNDEGNDKNVKENGHYRRNEDIARTNPVFITDAQLY